MLLVDDAVDVGTGAIASIRTLATSSRVTHSGGISPRKSIARSMVPESESRSSGVAGDVFSVAICFVRLQKNAFSNFSGVMASSSALNSSNIFCAS